MEIIKPDLKKAVRAIKKGMILACPTDTVYGLICGAGNKKAVRRIFLIKKRSKNKPLPIFVSNLAAAKILAKINKNQEKFLKKVWPGKTTVVLGAKKGGTIGLRVPKSKFIIDLIKRTGPLAETSANISGQPPAKSVEDILRQFEDRKRQPDLIIDGGKLKSLKPSKVIDLTGPGPIILRK